MPNPSPSPDHNDLHIPDVDKEMEKSEWNVEIKNYRELGLAIANFNKMAGNDPFIGTAEMSVDGNLRHLQIDLYFDENEKYRCCICNEIPAYITIDNPGICTFCGEKVCGNCHRDHQLTHWRPQRTIGGDIICTGPGLGACGKDQCPKCGGVPF